MSATTRRESGKAPAGLHEETSSTCAPTTATDSELDELIERAKRPVGAFRSGRSDLAENHDEAWAEILEEEMERWGLPERTHRVVDKEQRSLPA